MTGCYPVRVGMSRPEGRDDGSVLRVRSRTGLHPDEVTLAEVLRERGYATACIGKWHLGNREPFLPTAQGFDLYLGPAFRSAQQRRETPPLVGLGVHLAFGRHEVPPSLLRLDDAVPCQLAVRAGHRVGVDGQPDRQ